MTITVVGRPLGGELFTMDNILNQQRMPRKAKAVLNRMLENKTITREGLNFVICATDPFHDTEVCSEGYPDVTTTRSITQCVTKSVSVGPPSGVTGAWDAHVFFAPLTPCFSQSVPTATTTNTITTPITTTTDAYNIAKEAERKSKGKVNVIPVNGELKKATVRRVEQVNKRRNEAKDAGDTDEDSVDPDVEEMTTNFKALKDYANRKKHRDVMSTIFPGYFRTTMDAQGELTQTGFSLPVYSGWNCATVANGVDWLDASSGGSFPDISIPANYASGYWRIVGVGLEVVNTTAQLYKGGSVVVYKSPAPFQRSLCIVPFVGNFNCSSSTMPPTNVADATLYPNSKTWAAEDGCYLIATQNTIGNDYVSPVPGIGSLITPSSFTDLDTGAGWAGYFPYFDPPDDDNVPIQSSLSTNLPFDISGAIFTGLNVNSSLTITARYYIERHPTIADPDLLVLARTPAPYDPIALEIYSRAMSELPVGVPVGENPMGEWFNDVISAVANWAPKIGNALQSVGVPLAGPIGNMVGGFAKSQLVTRTIKSSPKGGKTVTTTVSSGKKKKKKFKKGPQFSSTTRFIGPVKSTARNTGPRRRPPTRRS